MKKHIFLPLGTFMIFFCVLYGSQKQKESIQQEKHEVKVRLVLVDVTITKDGKFITDLTKDDFELYEDGKRVPINSFELISFAERKLLPLKEREKKAPSPVPKKKLAVVFDGINTLPRHFRRGAEKIVTELIELVKLGNEVMIIQLDRKKVVEIIQPFTSNEELIEKAVARASGDIWVGKPHDVKKMQQDLGIESAGEQARGQRLLDNAALEQALALEDEYFKKQRFEISIGGILGVCNMIEDLPGRNSILLVSDGLPQLSPKGINTSINVTGSAGRLSGNTVTLVSVGGYGNIRVFDPFNILKKKSFKRGDEVIEELIRYANAQNISIYTLDPGTFTEYFFTVSFELESLYKKQEKLNQVQNLRWISEDTGAAWLRGAKKYDVFRQVISTDLNYYYQLSFYPQRREADDRYHKIEVKVKRKGVDVRFRKGYVDYSKEQEEKMLLVIAYYNPSLYKDLPFEAEFIPFHKDSDKYESWMNIALPVKELFREKEVAYGPKKFSLHIWIKDETRGNRSFGGQMTIPFNIDTSFMNLVKSTDYLCYHLKGPALELGGREYHAIFALLDPQTNEVGTWESKVSLPDFKVKKADIINCILGFATPNPEKGTDSFSLSRQDGGLEYGEIKFFPAVINRLEPMQDVSIFLQVFLPQGKIEIHPKFQVSGKDGLSQQISRELIAESWNEKSNVWSGIFKLDLKSMISDDYTLKVEIPVSEEGPVMSKDVKLIILRH